MGWDFSTDPEFAADLEWMDTFVRENVWPLETLADDLEWDQLMELMAPLQEQVKERELWATYLDPELGGQGYGQVKNALVNEVLARARWRRRRSATRRPTRATPKSSRWGGRPTRRSATCSRCSTPRSSRPSR